MIGSNVAINELFTRFALLFRGSDVVFTGFFESEGTSERAPFSADSTMSEVKEGVAVLMKASSF